MPFARCRVASRVHYAERGEARPGQAPVLLIHGAGASSAIWMMVIARLARRARVVAIDLPGHGPSAPPAAGAEVTIERYRDAVGELCAALGLGRAVLVGHSMGGLIALEAALAWPDHVAGLVLCGAGPRLSVDPALLRVIREDYPRFPAWLAERGLGPAAGPTVRRGFVAAGIVAPRQVTLADFVACEPIDVTERLPEVRPPVVWLDGADDRIVRATAGRPGEIRALAGVGHMTPIEAPAAIADAAAGMVGART